MNIDTILFNILFIGVGVAISILYTTYLKRGVFDRANIPKRFKNAAINILSCFGLIFVMIHIIAPTITFLTGYSDILALGFIIGVLITFLEFNRCMKRSIEGEIV